MTRKKSIDICEEVKYYKLSRMTRNNTGGDKVGKRKQVESQNS